MSVRGENERLKNNEKIRTEDASAFKKAASGASSLIQTEMMLT